MYLQIIKHIWFLLEYDFGPLFANLFAINRYYQVVEAHRLLFVEETSYFVTTK